MTTALTRMVTTNSSRRQCNRFRRKSRFFEALESRILLAATWDPMVPSGNWSDDFNWQGGTGPGGIPGSGDDVIISTTVTITMDLANPTIASLTIEGGAEATFAFNTTNMLTINNGIEIQQTANTWSGLLLTTTVNGITGTIHVKGNLTVTGPKTGGSVLQVEQNTSLLISGNLDMNGHKFKAFIDGTLTALNANFDGKDLPAGGGAGEVSILTIKGSLGSNQLWIGGNGEVNATLHGGTINAAHVFVINRSGFVAKQSATVNISGNLFIGEPLVPGSIPAGVLNGTGAIFTVEDAGSSVNVDFGLVRIKNTLNVRIQSKGELHCYGLEVTSDAKLVATDTGTLITVSDLAQITGGGAAGGNPGAIELYNNAKMEVQNTTTHNAEFLICVSPSLIPILPVTLLVDGGAKLVTDKAYIGMAPALPAALHYAHVQIKGAGSEMIVDSTFVVGCGLSATVIFPLPVWLPNWAPTLIPTIVGASTFFYVGDGAVVTVTSPALLTKAVHAYMVGLGTFPRTKALGVFGDILPGDATDPFGTLTINGNLDASFGMTLQSVLGSTSNENNQLSITGTAHLGGTINITLANDGDSQTYQLGDSFTLLTATGGLLTNNNGKPYQFSNLPAGYYSTHQYLPDGTPLPAVGNYSNYGYPNLFNPATCAAYSPDLPELAEGLSQNYTFPQRHNLRMAA